MTRRVLTHTAAAAAVIAAILAFATGAAWLLHVMGVTV